MMCAGGGRRQDLERFAHERQQVVVEGAVLVVVVEEAAAHARFPELLQVIGDFAASQLAIGVAVEKAADLVGHLDQTFDLAEMLHAVSLQ